VFVFSIDTLKEAREVERRMAELSTEDEEHITWASVGSKGKRKIKKRNFDDYELEQDDDGIHLSSIATWGDGIIDTLLSFWCNHLYVLIPFQAMFVMSCLRLHQATRCPHMNLRMLHQIQRVKRQNSPHLYLKKIVVYLYQGDGFSYVMMTHMPRFYLSGTCFKSVAANPQSLSEPPSTSTNHQGKVDLVTL
jgi:hypothetical protein